MATKESMITLEHLVDHPWLFDTQEPGSFLLIGSCTDTDEYLAKHGIARTPEYTPDPKVSLTRKDWDALTPHGRDTIRLLVRDGSMRLHEGDLGELEVITDRRPSWEMGDAA